MSNIALNFFVTTGICINGVFYNNGNIPVECTVSNITVQGNTKNNIPIIFPYGFGSVPNDNTQLVIFNSTNSEYGVQPIVFGSLNGLKYDFLSVGKGESYNYSNTWFIKYGNDSITATMLSNPDIIATLPSGEWLGYMMMNRITELENMIIEINQNITTLLSWSSLVTSALQNLGQSQVTALVQAPLIPDTTLSSDTTAINAKEYLLCPNAQPTP